MPSNGKGPFQVNFTTDIDFRAINSSRELEASGTGGESFKFMDGMRVSTKNQLVEVHVPLPLPHPALNLIHASVMKVKEAPPLTFTAVGVAQSADGLFGIRRILLLYGIGPKDELAHVGKHLHDQPLVPTYYSINSNTIFGDTICELELFTSTLELWEDERTGLFSTSEDANDASSGPRSAHIELLFTNGFAALGDTKQTDEGHFLTGSLTLASAEGGTFTHPNIDYGLLINEFDLVALQQALQDADISLNATPWSSPSPYIIASFGDWAIARDRNLVTVYHPVGTAKMSSDSDATGVTDSRLRVKGIKGVRVVDASIFPSIPECHPQGHVHTVGEKGAQLIKENHGLA
ncbi:hypothetical protein K435DRAFT_907151 [Dendrothele bispora CBS 962.96]|uniref:Glucose-methanol-choline oxidoreductase C-terminal domain-containing protein n=1 Tax=Dendrothele bispora (strain CBS 962.96) TaxID=1314807 RepID=A0A4S8LS33_DENBC|nr:hypothetical protein K435DRAFT_907151 [Dendrothele bispora CBS 962.96]